MKTVKYFDLKRCIGKLNELSAKNSPVETYLPLLQQLTIFHTFKGITIEDGFILYRSRVNEKGRLFEHVDELKYPKSEHVKRKGRLNEIGQSVLYASSSLLGTIIESRPNINYLVTISKIKQKNNNLVYFFPLGFTNHKFSNVAQNKCDSLIFNYLNSELMKTVKTDEEYNSTIAISNSFMCRKVTGELGMEEKMGRELAPEMGLIYPSVQSKLVSNKTTQNVAMNPSLFDNNYLIFEADVYCMTLASDTAMLVPLNNGTVANDGSINWRFTFSEMVNRASKNINLDGHKIDQIENIIF